MATSEEKKGPSETSEDASVLADRKSTLASIRNSTIGISMMGAGVAAGLAAFQTGGHLSSGNFFPGVRAMYVRAVELGDSAAPWLIPMFVAALVAALALLVLPNMRPSRRDSNFEQWNATRRYIARLGDPLCAFYILWCAGVLTALAWPGVPAGDNAGGVIVAALPIFGLAYFIARYQKGTIEQRMADIDRGLKALEGQMRRVQKRSDASPRARIWSVVIAIGLFILAIVMFAMSWTSLCAIVVATVIGGVAVPLFIWMLVSLSMRTVDAFSRIGTVICVWTMAVTIFILALGFALMPDSRWGPFPGIVGVVLCFVLFLIAQPWSFFHLDAFFMRGPIASLEHQRKRLEDQREGLKKQLAE